MTQPGQVVSRSGRALLSVPMHSHPGALLIVTLRGAATIVTHDGPWPLQPRSMLWVDGGTPHEVHTTAEHDSIILEFPPELVTRATGRIEASGFVHDLVERVGRAPDSERRARLTAVLVDELVEPVPADDRLRRVSELVAQQPATSVATICRGLGMSERTFRRWFRADVGTSFTQWHQQFLVENAIPRLERGDSVKAVAADLGYASTSAFIAMFKRVKRITPRRYLRAR